MGTMSAFVLGEASRGREAKVFDWDKAAMLIKERGATSARAGLSDDWKWTGGDILRDGKPIPDGDTYTYLASTWATPELEIDGEIIACYRMASDTPGWNSDTYWPESAVKLLTDH